VQAYQLSQRSPLKGLTTQHVLVVLYIGPSQLVVHGAIGADFHGAILPTVAGGKLRRHVRNWTRRTISSLFFCAENYILFSGNQQKLLPPELHFLTPICTKSFVGWGFAPYRTGGAYSALPAPQLYLGGLLLKGLVAWHNGRTSVSGRRTFPVLRSTCS